MPRPCYNHSVFICFSDVSMSGSIFKPSVHGLKYLDKCQFTNLENGTPQSFKISGQLLRHGYIRKTIQ